MRLRIIFLLFLVGILLVVPTVSAQAAIVPISSLPAVRLVTNSTADLARLGCTPIELADTATTVSVPTGQPYHVVPREDPSYHALCSPAAAQQLTVVSGQVAGIGTILGGATAGFLIGGPVGAVAGGATAALFDSGKEVIKKAVVDTAQGTFIRFANHAVTLLGTVGIWLTVLASQLLGGILVQGSFTTNAAVRAGWPFLQGVANLGFIFALLYIAFTTMFDIGGGNVRRLLPRLLIAALLINFSLVLATIFIDASRILMAIMVRLVGGFDDPSQLGPRLLASSGQLKGAFDISVYDFIHVLPAGYEVGDWTRLGTLILNTIIIWGFALALFFLAVAFMVRYALLLFLLILSPLAFLAAVLPLSESLSKKWWQTFIKWVLFGPAALFVLLLIVKVGEISVSGEEFYDTIARAILIMVLLYIAAMAGSFVGGAAGNMSVNIASGLTKRARRGATGTARLAGKGAYAGSKFVARPVTRRTRDFSREYTKPFRKWVGKNLGIGEYSPYDKDGKLKPGRTTAASRAGERAAPFRSPEAKAAQQAVASGNLYTTNAAGVNVANPALTRARLLKGDNRDALSSADVDRIVVDGIPEQIEMIVSNKDTVRKMGDGAKAGLLAGTADAARGINAATADKIAQQLNRTLRDIERQESQKT